MRKVIFLAVLLVLSFLSAKGVNASLITIDKEGNIIWNVLSYETPLAVPQKNLEVTSIKNTEGTNQLISLNRQGDKVSLKVGDDNEMDVTNVGGGLVEIEERADTKKIEIGLVENRFSIKEEGIIALSPFPIDIDPIENRLSIVTSSGKKYLGILPYEAIQIALRSKYINRVSGDMFEITEEERDISYSVVGERLINLFDLAKIPIPVTAKVSASSGEILSVDQPVWLKFIGFMFS